MFESCRVYHFRVSSPHVSKGADNAEGALTNVRATDTTAMDTNLLTYVVFIK
jgi:hypothetical protein